MEGIIITIIFIRSLPKVNSLWIREHIFLIILSLEFSTMIMLDECLINTNLMN